MPFLLQSMESGSLRELALSQYLQNFSISGLFFIFGSSLIFKLHLFPYYYIKYSPENQDFERNLLILLTNTQDRRAVRSKIIADITCDASNVGAKAALIVGLFE